MVALLNTIGDISTYRNMCPEFVTILMWADNVLTVTWTRHKIKNGSTLKISSQTKQECWTQKDHYPV